MSIEREYEIVLQSESEGGFSVFVPELPSVATQGETIEEATKTASRPRPSTAAASLSTRRERRAPGRSILD